MFENTATAGRAYSERHGNMLKIVIDHPSIWRELSAELAYARRSQSRFGASRPARLSAMTGLHDF